MLWHMQYREKLSTLYFYCSATTTSTTMTTMPSKPGVTRKCHCFEPTHPHGVSPPLSVAVGLNVSVKVLQESLMHTEQKGPPHWNSAGAILYHFCLFVVFIDAAPRDVTTIQTSSHFTDSVLRTTWKSCTWWANDWPEYSVGAVIGHLSLYFRLIGRSWDPWKCGPVCFSTGASSTSRNCSLMQKK